MPSQACSGGRAHSEDPVPLAASFFERPTVTVARDLLGAWLVRDLGAERSLWRVVETEAYVGSEDRACHASRGLTARTAPMFGPPGRAYVYLVYGLHLCLNVVTEAAGFPAAVLLRALEPIWPPGPAARGPGLVGRALGIDRALSGADLTGPPLFFSAPPDRLASARIACGPRVGVDYAGEWAARPWRFWIADSPAVSRPRRSVGRGRLRAE